MKARVEKRPQPAPGSVARTGRLAEIDHEGFVWVSLDGAVSPVMRALLGIPADEATLRTAITEQRPVLLIFPEPEGSPPIVLAFLQDRVDVTTKPREIRLEAGAELTLRCGKAQIILRRDGSVMIKGTRVLSASSGANKIKGASIALN